MQNHFHISDFDVSPYLSVLQTRLNVRLPRHTVAVKQESTTNGYD